MNDPERLDRELAILAADYEATREDQRQASVRQAAVLSAGIAVFAAFYYLAAEQKQYLSERPLLALALPLAPYFIAQTYVWYEMDTVLRGYYVRALERAIQERLTIPSALGSSVSLPSLGHLSYIVAAPRYSSLPVFALGIVAHIAVVALFGGSALLSILALPTVSDRIYATLLYATLAAFLFSVARRTTYGGARESFIETLKSYPAAFSDPLDRAIGHSPNLEHKRRVRYLLLPRLAEVLKWGTFLLAWAIALTVSMVTQPSWQKLEFAVGMAILYLLVFEYFMYQARYQWNDLRGAEREETGVSREERLRLPPGSEKASFAVMILRILTACYIIDLVFREGSLQHLRLAAFAVIAIPFVLALPYEALREVSDRKAALGRLRSLVHSSIYILVGFGFAIRIVLGVIIGTGLQFDSTVALAVLFIAASLTGSAETLAIWAIAAEVAARQSHVTPRPDTEALARYLDPLVQRLKPPLVMYRGAKIRRERDNLYSPWALLHLGSIGIATIFGLLLVNTASPRTEAYWWVSGIVVAAWLSAVLVGVHVDVGWGLVALANAAIITVLLLWPAVRAASVLAPIAPAVLMLIHLGDRRYSHQDFVLGAIPFLASSGRTIRAAIGTALQFLFGRRSAKRVFGRLAEVPSRES